MKVILLKDVPKVGHKYDVKTVADGFARHVLLPKGQAEYATPAALNRLEKLKGVHMERSVAHEEEMLAQLMRAQEVSFEITRKANKEGHLFAGLKKEDIVRLIHGKGFTFNEEQVILDKPIKNTGEYEFPVVVGSKQGICRLIVRAE